MIVVGCWGLLGPSPGLAQDADAKAKAKALYGDGVKAFRKGNYTDAIILFEEALSAYESPVIIRSLAAAYHDRYDAASDPADLRLAIKWYERYIELETDPQERVRVKKVLRKEAEPEWERLLAAGIVSEEPVAPPPVKKPKTRLVVSSQTPGARAAIDGGRLEDTGIVHDVDPGRHTVRVEAPGYVTREVTETAIEGDLFVSRVELKAQTARVSVAVPPGATVTVNGRRSEASFEVPAGDYLVAVTKRGHEPVARSLVLKKGQQVQFSAPMRKTTQRKASYYVLGGAGALTVAGTVTALVARSAQNEAEDIDADRGVVPLSPADKADYDDAVDRRDRYRGISYVLFGSALVAAVTGAGLYWFDMDQPEGATPLRRVVPTATGDGVGAAYVGSF